MQRRSTLLALAALATLAVAPLIAPAQASAWPAKPIGQVIPFPAGGTLEALAKVVRDEHDGWKAVIQRAGIRAE